MFSRWGGKSRERLLLGAGLCLVIVFFFWRYFLEGKLPVTSGDPAILFHFHAQAAGWLKQGIIPFWQPGKLLGVSLFSMDISLSPFHLSSLFFALAPDYPSGQVLFVAAQVLTWIFGTYFYLRRDLGVRPFLAFLPGALMVFTPSFRNEFLFNVFGWMGLLPFLLMLTGRFHRTGRYIYSLGVALLLVLMFHLANLAAVQFCLIFLGLYSLCMKCSKEKSLVSWGRGAVHYGLVVFFFLGSVTYYLYPMWLESLQGERSHIYEIFDTIPLWAWLRSLFFPFTSWIFIDEKMLTTGILTYLESLNLYLHVLLLPVYLLFFHVRRRFRAEERFFFYFVAGFIVLSILNRHVPVLGFLVRITKGTGWHRSLPLFYFSGCVALALCFERYCEYKEEAGKRSEKAALIMYRVLWSALVTIYGVASAGVLLVWALWSTIGQSAVLGAAAFFTPRPAAHLAFYLDYLFSPFRGVALFAVPVSILVSLVLLERLRRRGMEAAGSGGVALALSIVVLAGQFAASELYYPFNRGVVKPHGYRETAFLKRLPSFSRLAVVFNNIEDVESHVIRQRRLENNHHNPRLHLLTAEYPEMGRFQSDATMDGSFFNTLGLLVYNRGVHFPGKRLTRFHAALVRENARLSKIFRRKKGYLRLGPKEAGSKLLDLAGVTHVLSSLPIEGEGLTLVFQGDAYNVYRNEGALPRFLLVGGKAIAATGEQALKALLDPGFDARRKVVLELNGGPLSFPSNDSPGTVEVVGFAPAGFELRVKSAKASFLLVRDSYHPGWRAEIDGRRVDILRANFVFQGVMVPSGEHKVVFRFVPPGFRKGVLVSLGTLLIGLVMGIWVGLPKGSSEVGRPGG